MPKKTFTAKPGQVDYTNIRWAPVINCVVRHKGKMLLVKRSKHLDFHPGVWNGISGFLDDKKSLREKVLEELREEIGMPVSKVRAIKLGPIFDADAPRYHKTWIVHPVLVDVSTDAVTLDWEGAQYAWVAPRGILNYKLMPGFIHVLKALAIPMQ